jgi:Cu2+-exporting ATPase
LVRSSLALPIAAGIFEPLGFVLRPEVGAISMAGSSVIVAVNAAALKRLRLPDQPSGHSAPPAPRAGPGSEAADAGTRRATQPRLKGVG